MPKVSQAHMDARREEIVDAALTCYARQGTDRTTIQAICAESGLSAGAIYGHFENKDAILDAVFERHRAGQESHLAALAAAPDPLAAFRGGLRGMWGIVRMPQVQREHRTALIMHAEAMHNEGIARRYAEFHRTLAQAYGDVLRAAQADGRVPAHVDVEHLVWFINSAYQGFRVLGLLDTTIDAARIGAVAVAAFEAILALPAPDPSSPVSGPPKR